jgi:hypothetical protein
MLIAMPVIAQGGADGYNAMSVKAGMMKGNIQTGKLDSLTGGVVIELLSEDASQPNLPIRANTITFEWTEGSSMPSKIKMDGNVDIKHPQGQIKAQHADWNLESGDLVFTGNPVMDSDTFKNLAAERILINMETGAFSLEQTSVDKMPLKGADGGGASSGGGGGAPMPGDLTEADITDFEGLINTLKTQAKAEGDNPGKQILAKLNPTVRGMLESQETSVLVGAKADIIKQLNGVIRKPGMYKRAAWEGIALSEDLNALIAKKDQTPEEQSRQNRLLLHAAYPAMIKGL